MEYPIAFPPADPQVDLSIIIVSWNVRDLLRDCLAAVGEEASGASGQVEVIVVDGDSADGSADMVAEEFPELVLVRCDENVGFPRGNNIGLAKATGRYILLLNPDTVVQPNALSRMIAFLDEHQDVGLVGAQLLNGDGSIQHSRYRFPRVVTAYFESTWLQGIAPQSVIDHYHMNDMPLDRPVDADWLNGACLMTRREIIEQVGGLDEGYFMYSEELDWCRRIKEAGWRIVYEPAAQVTHFVGQSSEQAVTARHINFQRAKLRYFRKYHGALAAGLLRAFLLKSYLWQIILEGAKGLVGHKRALRWQRVGSYWAVVKSGLRPAGY